MELATFSSVIYTAEWRVSGDPFITSLSLSPKALLHQPLLCSCFRSSVPKDGGWKMQDVVLRKA